MTLNDLDRKRNGRLLSVVLTSSSYKHGGSRSIPYRPTYIAYKHWVSITMSSLLYTAKMADPIRFAMRSEWYGRNQKAQKVSRSRSERIVVGLKSEDFQNISVGPDRKFMVYLDMERPANMPCYVPCSNLDQNATWFGQIWCAYKIPLNCYHVWPRFHVV